MLEKALDSPLDYKEIKPVIPKGNQSWIFIGRTDAEAETPILWPPDVESWLIGKDPHIGKDWGQEEKGTTGDEMAGWHHRLNKHEFEQAPGVEMDREAWHAAVRGVTKSRTWVSDWTDWEDSLLDVETTFVSVFTHQLGLCCAWDTNARDIRTMSRPWGQKWCSSERKSVTETDTYWHEGLWILCKSCSLSLSLSIYIYLAYT